MHFAQLYVYKGFMCILNLRISIMVTAKDVAQWMLQKLEETGYLSFKGAYHAQLFAQETYIRF